MTKPPPPPSQDAASAEHLALQRRVLSLEAKLNDWSIWDVPTVLSKGGYVTIVFLAIGAFLLFFINFIFKGGSYIGPKLMLTAAVSAIAIVLYFLLAIAKKQTIAMDLSSAKARLGSDAEKPNDATVQSADKAP